MFVAGAAPKGSLFGTTDGAAGIIFVEELKSKPGNPVFPKFDTDAAMPPLVAVPETEIAEVAPPEVVAELALLLPIFGQAEVLLFCTGLVPVVGHGLVLSCVKLEAPVNGLIGDLPALLLVAEELLLAVAVFPVPVPQFGTQLGEKPLFSLGPIGGWI